MLGCTPSEVGLRILPYSIGAGIGSFLIGLIVRVTGKYGPFRYITPIFMINATLGFAVIGRNTPWVSQSCISSARVLVWAEH
jgi:hypothetical protein